MKAELADYILCLADCLAHTNYANDRPLYEKYLADAAVMLALVERGVDSEELKHRVAQHERLWGQTWVVNGDYQTAHAAWQKFRSFL